MRFFFIRVILLMFVLNIFLTPMLAALAADLEFTADTTLSLSGVTFTTLTVASGSKATSLTVGTTTFTVTVASGDTFTVNASSDMTFSNDGGVSTTCGATSSIAIVGLKTDLVVTPSNSSCPRRSTQDTTPPSAPTNAKVVASASDVTLTWKDPVASDLSLMVIHRNSGGTTPLSGEFYGTVERGVQTYRDPVMKPGETRGVQRGETYKYLVRARDATGNLELNENVLTVTVPQEQPKEEPKKEEKKEAPTPPDEKVGEVEVPTTDVGKKKEEKPPSAKASEGKKEEVKKEPTPLRIEEKTNGIIVEAAKPIVTAKSTAAIAEAAGKTPEPVREEAVREESKIAAVIGAVKETTEVALVGFIVYGTTATEKLGEGERAGSLNSYKAAYGRLPTTEAEWQDTLRIAGGALPEKASLGSEQRAITAFKRIYKRAPEIAYDKSKSILTAEESDDRTALLLVAYGIRPEARDLEAEADVIGNFISIFGKKPVFAQEWDTVRMMAYAAPP